MYHKLKIIFINNKKVIENYFFMTSLSFVNSFFYLLLYPYIINALGIENFGIYIFAISIISYASFLFNFGFNQPALKAISLNSQNHERLSQILSEIISLKTYLYIICGVILFVLVLIIPELYNHKWIYFWSFISSYSTILFPQWYFQGIQQMKLVTYIQLVCKILSLPFILFYINDKNDTIIYASIVSLSMLLGGIIAYFIILNEHKLRIKFTSYHNWRYWLNESLPFFYSSLAGSIKEYSIPIIIGACFGMKDVAIYDIANRIILVPRTIFMNINGAIFPKLIINSSSELIRKIIKYEFFISGLVVILIILFGNKIVYFLAREVIDDAYYLSILFSITIVSWLVVGAYINFVFIPNNKYYFITYNQLLALSVYIIASVISIVVYNNIIAFGASITISGVVEIMFCIFLTKKFNLLK